MLWGVCLVLLMARAALTFVPGMWGWGLNAQRFLPPIVAWGTWGLAAAALAGPIARPASGVLERTAGWLARRPVLTVLVLAVAGASLVWLVPDRTHHVGDFFLREQTVIEREPPGNVFVQATPLDLFLHYHLPRMAGDALGLRPNSASRVLGMFEAALLALLAWGFALTLRHGGIAGVASGCIVFFGGYLGLYTGYGKSFSELALLTGVVGTLGLSVVRGGPGLIGFGLALSCALLVHRMALVLWPAALVVWALELRGGPTGRRRRAALAVGIALPLAVLAWRLPGLLHVLGGIDLKTHLLPDDARGAGGPLAALWGGTRLLDVANLLLVISPLALAVPLLAAFQARPPGRARELAVLAAIAMPLLAVLLVGHPAQGIFRDWDDFAALGMSLSLVCAWQVGGILQPSVRWRWAGVSVILLVAVTTLQWLLLWTDAERGLRRAEAFVAEAPLRAGRDAGKTWEFIGMRRRQLGQGEQAAEALTRAARETPSPAIMREWALVEAERGRLEEARDIYHRLLERAPADRGAWFSLAAISTQLGDYVESRRALQELLRIDPTNRVARGLLADIDRYHPAPTPSSP